MELTWWILHSSCDRVGGFGTPSAARLAATTLALTLPLKQTSNRSRPRPFHD